MIDHPPRGNGIPDAERTLPTISIEETVVGRRPFLDDATENYHEASRAYPGILDPAVRGAHLLEISEEMRASAARSTKRYPHARVVALPPPALGDVKLADTLIARRSIRSCTSAPLQLEQLSTLLASAYGVSAASSRHEQALRTAPSAGALYPLELYVVAAHVDGLERTLVHYDPLRHVAECLRPLDPAQELAALTPYDDVVRASAALIVITAMFWRSRFKYGARAYRFTLIEAGHVGQNLLLAATALKLATVPIGGFYDRRVDCLLDIDGIHEASVYLFPVATAS